MNRQEEILHQKIAIEWHNKMKLTPEFQRLICNYTNQSNTHSGNKARSMGVKKGIPDWMYLRENGKIAWIELKISTGVQSKEQLQFQSLCGLLGHDYYICYDEVTFWQIIGFNQPD